MIQPLIHFFDMFVAAATATVIATSIFLMTQNAALSDPVAKHSADGIRIHIKMNGNIV